MNNKMIEAQQLDMIKAEEEKKKNRILWIDIETTGKKYKKDKILQIAFIITDNKNKPLIEKEYIVKHKKNRVFKKAVPYVQNMHSKTGLWDRLEVEGIDLKEIDEEISKIIRANMYCDNWGLIIGGNSVSFDNHFIEAQMPLLGELLSYRVMDMSSVLQWFRVYGNKVDTSKNRVKPHDALDDIRNSIAQSEAALNKLEEIKNKNEGDEK